ncbi:MAG: hypothetical protein AAFY29_05110 [Pseudomonadota bacterium]
MPETDIVSSAPRPEAWWQPGAVLLERPSSALFRTGAPMELREQLK